MSYTKQKNNRQEEEIIWTLNRSNNKMEKKQRFF